MWGEELAGSVNQHVVQLRPELTSIRQSKMPAYPIKLRSQRLHPPGLIDRNAALGNFPGIAHAWVQARLVLETVTGRAGDPDELARRARSYGKTDAPDAPDSEMKIGGGGGKACCEFPWPSNLAELSTDFGQWGLRVLDLSWC